MLIITKTLTKKTLDYAVALAQNLDISQADLKVGVVALFDSHQNTANPYNPSTNWAIGGPLIEGISISWYCMDGEKVTRWKAKKVGHNEIQGATQLEAGLRFFVFEKLGSEIEIPEELLKELL